MDADVLDQTVQKRPFYDIDDAEIKSEAEEEYKDLFGDEDSFFGDDME